MESYIKHKHRLAKYGMVPKHSFLQEISSGYISTVPENFYDEVEKGSIVLKKSPTFSFCEKGILVEGQAEPLETDLVILATGFRGDKNFADIFKSPSFRKLIPGTPDSGVSIYRFAVNLIPNASKS